MAFIASRPVFAILQALVEERTGLNYTPADQELFLERVASRAEEAGFDSLLDYYYFLRYDAAGAAEVEQLVNHLVVNETFFFREVDPLQMVVSRVIAPRVREGGRPRVWSAACSTGEEPLTLAMLLAQDNLLDRVELTASDISSRVLDKARAGRFSRRALREVARPDLARRFLREEAGGFTVAAELRAAVDWRRINLTDPVQVASVGACDVILCRNVLIYFSDETVVRVIQSLSDLLAPGGILLVGVSESLLRFGTSLSCEELDHVFFYRKAA